MGERSGKEIIRLTRLEILRLYNLHQHVRYRKVTRLRIIDRQRCALDAFARCQAARLLLDAFSVRQICEVAAVGVARPEACMH